MKNYFAKKNMIALAAAMAIAAGQNLVQAQSVSPSAAADALPADIVPGSPLAEVVKMLQGGVAMETIQAYVANSPSAFNLDADKIVFLKDEGAPSTLVNAMLDRDKTVYASTVAPPAAPAPVSAVVSAPDTAPPTAEVTDNYFYSTLSPYGSWVDVAGYGRCWRPTTVIYDQTWQPYCDRGHWVYTDCGWYWQSDYSWGVTFHYGRWFRHARYGWCWYPDTVWAPSWVTWRSGGDYCGWAPLPPFAEYRPGIGFCYRGVSVAVGFDFGLDAGCFTFVSPDHFCDHHPRSYSVSRDRVPQIFHQTTVINNYNVNNRTIINRGISVQRINEVTHREITPVHVGSLPNAERQGWRGPVEKTPVRNASPHNNEIRNSPAGHNNYNNGNASPHQGFNPTAQPLQHGGGSIEPSHPPVQNHYPSGVNNQVPSQNGLHTAQPVQPRQSVAPITPNPTVPPPHHNLPTPAPATSPQPEQTRPHNPITSSVNPAAQSNGWQNRNAGTTTFATPQQHGAWQLEQHRPAAPSAPIQPQPQPRPVEPVQPHSYTAPAQPAPAPAPGQSHNSGNSQGNSRGKQNN